MEKLILYDCSNINIVCWRQKKINHIKKGRSLIRYVFIISISCFLLTVEISSVVISSNNKNDFNDKIIAKISRELEIPAGSDYHVKFNSDTCKLEGKEINSATYGLSDKVKNSIAKSPRWIRRELTRQFHNIDGEEYADLILNSNKKYVDEIAFSIACSSLGDVPSVDVIRDNAFFLYKNDNWIRYADIVDYDDLQGNYYSTIRYWVIENGIEKQFEYPMELYYWYVVHPQVTSEEPEYTYDFFWRSYLFNHNDLGYPLLKEKLSDIDYLWDCKSYYQPGNRLWKWSIDNHPTAIEVISYWIGKTVPAGAFGDRPGQPSVIAHEHNGWCGELQRLAVAAQRAALIPSLSACNIGEDHVWREFYERGWHENDNWWTDSGGAVDEPDVYGYGWGKNMSSIFAWKGDDSIYDLTPRYIHSDDRITAKFIVRDHRLRPVDGARVTVVVNGIKDITWLKNNIWTKIVEIWDKLPDIIKGRFLQLLYSRIEEKFDKIPDVTDGLTITTWGYTDINGECSFELGKNCEYLFVIQNGNLKKPWQLAKNNALRILRTHTDKTFNVFFNDVFHRVQRHCDKEISGDKYHFDVVFNTSSYQLQKNVRNDGIGKYDTFGRLDFFILDETNFIRYSRGLRFNCFNYFECEKTNINFDNSNGDLYFVFRNHAMQTNVILDFSIQVKTSIDIDKVQIVTPDTSIFDTPVFNVGDLVNISGIGSDDVILIVGDKEAEILVYDYQWTYLWDTVELMPGKYKITANCGSSIDNTVIQLIDLSSPIINIIEPENNKIIMNDIVVISGQCFDNTGVERVEVAIDNGEFRKTIGTKDWFIEWDVSKLNSGDHKINVKAFDLFGKSSIDTVSIAINNSCCHQKTPNINDFYYKPKNSTNTSNIVIYANVSSDSSFSVKKVVLFWDDGTTIKKDLMYRYADNPIQSRHEEDPLQNQSNNPIFGLELGQFPSDSIITYWIAAYDTADNTNTSSKKTITVSD